MNPHPRLTRYTVLCLAAFLVTLVLLAISSASDHTGEIVYGYAAMLVFLFLSLPMHLVGISATVYTGAKSPRGAQPSWPYLYFGFWTVVHVIVFRGFLFEEVPDLARKAMFAATHQAEIELARVLGRHESNPAAVKELIEAGADVNLPDRYAGYPPLVRAARQGDPAVVAMLLEAGADPHVVVPKIANTGVLNELYLPEVTPLGFAAVTRDDRQRLAVVELLLGAGVDAGRGHAVLGACAFGDIVTLEVLLAAGARPDVADLEGFTCAHAAAYNGRLEMLEYLLARGHAVDARDEQNRAPLDVALFRRDEAVLLLLQHGHRPRDPEALRRFVDQPPATDAKLRIREQFIDNEEPD